MQTSTRTVTGMRRLILRASRWALRSVGITGFVLASAGCGSDSTGVSAKLEALPVAAATVQAAVDLMTASPIAVPTNCGSSPSINCFGGSAGTALSLPVSHTTPIVVQVSPGVYTFGTDLTINSATNIPVTYSGVNCGIVLNTTSGTSPTVHLAGTATFTSNSSDNVLNRLDIVPVLSGVESADIGITGGPLCSFGSIFQAMVVDMMVQNFQSLGGRLCGTPGPTLLGPCPEPARSPEHE